MCLIDSFVKKINFVLVRQNHQKKSFGILNNIILMSFLDITYIYMRFVSNY